jgi:hypothetical protein
MYWIKAFQRRLCIPIYLYLWQALRLQTSLALLENTQEYTVSNLCLFLSLSRGRRARPTYYSCIADSSFATTHGALRAGPGQ